MIKFIKDIFHLFFSVGGSSMNEVVDYASKNPYDEGFKTYIRNLNPFD